MVASLGLATWLTPRASWNERLGRPNYQAIVPASFGDWIDVGDTGVGVVSPTQGEALRTIYSQTVSRVYLHKPTGRRIMLSLAYGEVQQGVTQLHRPESCYSSQGFQIKRLVPGELDVGDQLIKVFRMTAVFGNRIEQVTYWIRMGDQLLQGPAYELNLMRMAMGLRGIVADGLLFRISEITPDVPAAVELQDKFAADLLASVRVSDRITLIGGASSHE